MSERECLACKELHVPVTVIREGTYPNPDTTLSQLPICGSCAKDIAEAYGWDCR
jgi:hypothetical protein